MRTPKPAGWPKRMRDWEGRLVRTKRAMRNGYVKIPEGTVMRIRTARSGVSLETVDLCPICRVRCFIRRVDPQDLHLFAEGRVEHTELPEELERAAYERLRKKFDPDVVEALARRLGDDWWTIGAAARALGYSKSHARGIVNRYVRDDGTGRIIRQYPGPRGSYRYRIPKE